jgi:hypothetical protein
MAETTEKIIFSVQIDQSDAIAKVAGLTKEINALKDSNKQLALAEGDNSKAIAENNVLIQAATNERRKTNSAIVASVEAFGKEAKSIDDARTAVKQLTIERNKLDLSTDAGKAKQKELNASIDQHNKFIKENVDQYQQQKINIGNYASALGGSNTALGQTISRLQSVKEGFTKGKEALGGMETQQASFNTVLKANVIGIIIVALTALYTLFTKFEPIVDKVKAGFAGFSAAIDVVTARLITFGKGTIEVIIAYFQSLINTAQALGQILSGDFSKGFSNLKTSFDGLGVAVDKTSQSFAGMGSEMAAAAKEAFALEEALQDLEDRQTAQIIVNAESEQQINKLILQSKNRTLTEAQRLGLIDKASATEKKNFEDNKKLAEDAYQIALKNYALKTKLSTQELEELMTNTKRRAEIEGKASQLSGDEVKKLAEQKAGIINLETESVNLQEKLTNRRDAIVDAAKQKREAEEAKQEAFLEKQIAADEKLVAETDKALQKTIKDREDAFNKEKALLEKKQTQDEIFRTKSLSDGVINQKTFDDLQLQAKQTALEQQIELDKKYYRNTSDSELALAQTKLEINKKSTEDKKRFSDADIASSVAVANATMSVIGELASAAEQGSDLQKALALTNVAINLGTAIGNLTATTSAPSPDNLLTGGVSGFVKYAAGITQIIAAIASARNIIGGAAAGGGDFMTNGPTMLLVGDNPGGRERVTVEPISGKGQTTINPNSGLIAMAGGGTLTTSGYGGFAERNGGLKTMIDYNQLAKAMQKAPSPIIQISELNKKQASLSKVSKTVNITD